MGANIYLEDKFVRIKGSGSGSVDIDGDKKQITAGRISIDGDNGKIKVYFPPPTISIKDRGVKLAVLPAQKPPGPGTTQPLDLTRDLVEEILNLRKYVKDLYIIAGKDAPPDLK